MPSELLLAARAQPAPTVERAHRLADIGRAAASGNEGALEKLLRALAPDMLRVMRTVLGARYGGIDQLLQDCVLEFVGALGRLGDGTTVSAFALTMAFRHALAAKQRGDDDVRWPAAQDGPAFEPFPEIERRRAVVADLLTTIPRLQAEALGLRTVVGLSVDEVARATAAPATTVRSRLRVAKESLRRSLESDPALRGLVQLESAS